MVGYLEYLLMVSRPRWRAGQSGLNRSGSGNLRNRVGFLRSPNSEGGGSKAGAAKAVRRTTFKPGGQTGRRRHLPHVSRSGEGRLLQDEASHRD